MKVNNSNQPVFWRNHDLFGIEFARYRLQHYSFPRHFHNHFVIELVLSGADSFYCQGKNFLAQPNDIVLINPGEVHTGGPLQNHSLEYISLYPYPETLKEILNILELPCREPGFGETISNSELIRHKMKMMFENLSPVKSSDHPTETIQLEETFYDFFFTLFRQKQIHQGSEKIQKDKRVQIVKDFIRSNFNTRLSLTLLARLVNINPYHLCRLFKKDTGLAPYEYVLVCRVEKAKEWMRAGKQVEEASRITGFYDSPHFNRLFRKMTGLSPKNFRLSKCQDRTSII